MTIQIKLNAWEAMEFFLVSYGTYLERLDIEFGDAVGRTSRKK